MDEPEQRIAQLPEAERTAEVGAQFGDGFGPSAQPETPRRLFDR